MNTKRIALFTLVLVTLTSLVACNLPFSSTPTPFVFPTPNQTMTALFQNPVVIPPTVTVQAPPTQPVQTATQPLAPTPTQPVIPVNTATLPPTPTKTSVPTNMRSGPNAVAAYLSTAPTIDGPWSEWTNKAYPADFVVFGSANRKDGDDLGASYRMGWDNTYLYLAVKVYDDVFVQNASGAQIFKGDSIELLLDTNVSGDFFTQSLSSDDYQLGIAAGKGSIGANMEGYLWYPSGKAGNLSGVKMAAVSSDGIWRLEAAIPWSVLGVTPTDGLHLGFVISVSDNDKADENVQQSMVSSTTSRIFTDPTTWGDLVLDK